MPTQRSFKRLVRARMEKTGESYTAARAALLTAEDPPRAITGPALSMSDATIRATTGRGWEAWFDLLYEAFVDEEARARWLPAAPLSVRTATRPKSARFDWGGGPSRVVVAFVAKGEAKSSAALAHERLADAEEAERMKAFWRDGVAALKEQLEA